MAAERLEQLFPRLLQHGYRIESPRTPRYNCIAWAGGDTTRWWWPGGAPFGPYYWPDGVPAEEKLESFELAFGAQGGYQRCDCPDLEPDFEKIAVYVDNPGQPTHAARQLESRRWTSKLGRLEDIEHATLAALEGPGYGRVGLILRRPRSRGQQ